jgi:hypothetical protein
MEWFLEHAFDRDWWAFGYATWQAGLNMIPSRGYKDYTEAWAQTKMED